MQLVQCFADVIHPAKHDRRPLLRTHDKTLRTKTSRQSNLTKDRIAVAHGRFIRIRQEAPVCTGNNGSLVPTNLSCKQHLVPSSWVKRVIMRHDGSATGRAMDFAISRSRVQILLEATPRNKLGQVVYTYVPLSPSSITWYRPKGGDALRLGR